MNFSPLLQIALIKTASFHLGTLYTTPKKGGHHHTFHSRGCKKNCVLMTKQLFIPLGIQCEI